MKLVAFTGAMGVGKSTAISLLQDITGKKIRNVKFAQPLYDMQEYIYNRIILGHKRLDTFVKDRKLLQWLGTEWGRETIGKDLWITIWREEVKYAQENYPHDIVVCDDVRFDNEAQIVKNLNGIIVKIESNKNAQRIDTKTGITGHSSENGLSLDKIDFTIHNDGSLEDLKNQLINILKQGN